MTWEEGGKVRMLLQGRKHHLLSIDFLHQGGYWDPGLSISTLHNRIIDTIQLTYVII